ncbi:hypothetical protein AC481_06925 [miscellaneous Crenarchaeota group archaeon SMTZ-80]|nr:MAG: hypothetical protein AC481_06925 [miscellaneous Crenarchaeota group archaeon SMTZ-80]
MESENLGKGVFNMNSWFKIYLVISFILFSIPLYAQEKEDQQQKIIKELQIQIEEIRKIYETRIAELEARMVKLDSLITPADSLAEKKEAGEIGLEDIFKDLAPAEEATLKSAQEIEMQNILVDVGQYEESKFPWFPALGNPFLGLMIEVPARFTTQKGVYESVNQIEMREAELNIYSNIDPFIRAFALISGAAETSIEEAYFLTASLPYDLQIRGGKFFANLGRLNTVHTHDLPFVDQPLTMQNFLGELCIEEDKEVLLDFEPQYKGSGAEILWLAPTSIYWKLLVGIYNQFTDRNPESFYAQYLGAPEGFRFRNRGIKNFGYTLGSQLFFELGDDHSLRIDTYGNLDAPNHDLKRSIEIFGLTYRWFPLEYGMYKGMEWTTELYANQERFLKAGTNVETQNTWGIYSYIDYKLGRRFSLSALSGWSQFRFDRDAEAFQFGSALSYKPSERQRIRAQIDYIDKQDWKNSVSRAIGLPTKDSDFWQFVLQWTVVMGSHTHTYK